GDVLLGGDSRHAEQDRGGHKNGTHHQDISFPRFQNGSFRNTWQNPTFPPRTDKPNNFLCCGEFLQSVFAAALCDRHPDPLRSCRHVDMVDA
ncbi:hypothetical protein ABTL53_19315, partial [Acinetobacter baumannii]